MRESFADGAFRFYRELKAPRVPAGISTMNPYRDARIREYVRCFLGRFYADSRPRSLILGINPGRFGAGVTGVTFSDPVALSNWCAIETHLPMRRELSSEFIYGVIDEMGGVEPFFGRFFMSAVCPLGFTRGGKNVNYYDDRRLQLAVKPFIEKSLRRHLEIGGRPDAAVILGRGENLRFVRALNAEHRFFDRLVGLDHPRFIMQYRRRRLREYVKRYVDALRSVSGER